MPTWPNRHHHCIDKAPFMQAVNGVDRHQSKRPVVCTRADGPKLVRHIIVDVSRHSGRGGSPPAKRDEAVLASSAARIRPSVELPSWIDGAA